MFKIQANLTKTVLSDITNIINTNISNINIDDSSSISSGQFQEFVAGGIAGCGENFVTALPGGVEFIDNTIIESQTVNQNVTFNSMISETVSGKMNNAVTNSIKQ